MMLAAFTAQDWVLIIGAIGGALGAASAAIIKAVRALGKEFSSNGGSSMRDAVDRIETKVEEALSTLSKHQHQDDERFTNLEKLITTVALTRPVRRIRKRKTPPSE